MINIPKNIQHFRFIKTREKIPFEKDWQNTNNYTYKNTTFSEYLSQNTTYGVLCGLNNLLVVDLDSKDVQDALLEKHKELFENTFTVISANKKLYHFYFVTDVPPESFKCLDKEKNTLLDAQGIGKQVIGPNSTLSNGNTYEVFCDRYSLNVVFL